MLATALRVAHIVLSLGLVLIIERFKLNPKWKWALWGLIIANEIRGLVTVYFFGAEAFDAIR